MGHRPEQAGGEPVRTPAFDRLAARGTVFDAAYCQMPLCTPSRLCILTGREARRCGAWSNQSVLRPELPTLPEAFAGAGYETALVGKMHLGGNRQFVGFRQRPYGDLTGKCGHQWEPLASEGRTDMRVRTSAAGVTEVPESLIQDQVVAQETVAFLREHAAARPDTPWMVCASFSRPHFPLTAPKRWIDTYTGRVPPPKVPASGDAFNHPMSVGMRRGFQADAVSEPETMNARAAYFACVSYLDEVIGDLFARLGHSGLLKDTIIVYTTDHGEMAGEHGVWWKNGWYEACTRVPFIVSTPEQRRGDAPARHIYTPVGLVDLLPTLCGLTGVETPDGVDGRDLSDCVVSGIEPDDRPVFCDALTPRWGAGTEFRSIRWKHYKYVRFRDAAPLMFDLDDDPGEQHNLLTRDLDGDAAEAKRFLEKTAAESIDFDLAEEERTARDGSLRTDYAQNLPPATMNQYLMPSGKLVNADDPLYNPTVIAESPGQAFSDWPEAKR
jgi:choline-sulfatase